MDIQTSFLKILICIAFQLEKHGCKLNPINETMSTKTATLERSATSSALSFDQTPDLSSFLNHTYTNEVNAQTEKMTDLPKHTVEPIKQGTTESYREPGATSSISYDKMNLDYNTVSSSSPVKFSDGENRRKLNHKTLINHLTSINTETNHITTASTDLLMNTNASATTLQYSKQDLDELLFPRSRLPRQNHSTKASVTQSDPLIDSHSTSRFMSLIMKSTRDRGEDKSHMYATDNGEYTTATYTEETTIYLQFENSTTKNDGNVNTGDIFESAKDSFSESHTSSTYKANVTERVYNTATNDHETFSYVQYDNSTFQNVTAEDITESTKDTFSESQTVSAHMTNVTEILSVTNFNNSSPIGNQMASAEIALQTLSISPFNHTQTSKMFTKQVELNITTNFYDTYNHETTPTFDFNQTEMDSISASDVIYKYSSNSHDTASDIMSENMTTGEGITYTSTTLRDIAHTGPYLRSDEPKQMSNTVISAKATNASVTQASVTLSQTDNKTNSELASIATFSERIQFNTTAYGNDQSSSLTTNVSFYDIIVNEINETTNESSTIVAASNGSRLIRVTFPTTHSDVKLRGKFYGYGTNHMTVASILLPVLFGIFLAAGLVSLAYFKGDRSYAECLEDLEENHPEIYAKTFGRIRGHLVESKSFEVDRRPDRLELVNTSESSSSDDED